MRSFESRAALERSRGRGDEGERWLAALAALTMGLLGCAAPKAPGPLQLVGDRWELVAITSMDDAQPPWKPADSSRYWIEFGSDGRLLLKMDCNNGRSSWQSEPAPDANPARRAGSLQLGALVTTRVACPPGSLEPKLTALLPFVRSYVIENGQLHLSLMADGGVLSWKPVAPSAPVR